MKNSWPPFRVVELLLLLILGWAGSVPAATLWTPGPAGPEPATARLASDVGDPVFALLAGLLDDNVYGRLDPAFVDSVVVVHGETKLPHRSMRWLTRDPSPARRRATLGLLVEEGFKVPVPYSILGYNPGSLSTSEEMELWEWALGDLPFRWIDDEGQTREFTARNATLFGLARGEVRMDVDWWLDKLLGSRLDDVDLVGFLLFHRDDVRYAVAFGYNPDRSGRTGVFDLTHDEIVFPAPRAYLNVGRTMRARVEGWLRRP